MQAQVHILHKVVSIVPVKAERPRHTQPIVVPLC
jgi:hypothetical protein